jgi:glycosyltransferase involved in cell wall biosynthesis
MAGRVRVGGFADADEKRRLFADHDVFLNTSRVDNRPVSVVEAAACGLCVVSTDVGGVPDLLVHEESALLVPPDDPAALAAAVRRLLDEPGLAGRLSDGGRAVAEAGQPDAVVERWEALLSERGG